MKAVHFPRHFASARSDDRTLLLVATREPLRLMPTRRRPWDRPLARSRALTLDRDLAAGCGPDGSQLHAVRAAMLVSPSTRRQLAERFEALQRIAAEPARRGDCRIPLARMRIQSVARDNRRALRLPARPAAGPRSRRGAGEPAPHRRHRPGLRRVQPPRTPRGAPRGDSRAGPVDRAGGVSAAGLKPTGTASRPSAGRRCGAPCPASPARPPSNRPRRARSRDRPGRRLS